MDGLMKLFAKSFVPPRVDSIGDKSTGDRDNKRPKSSRSISKSRKSRKKKDKKKKKHREET